MSILEQNDYFTSLRRTFNHHPHSSLLISITGNAVKGQQRIETKNVADADIRSCFCQGSDRCDIPSDDDLSIRTLVDFPALQLVVIEDIPDSVFLNRIPTHEESSLRKTQALRRSAYKDICERLQLPQDRPRSDAVAFRSFIREHDPVSTANDANTRTFVYHLSFRRFNMKWAYSQAVGIRAVICHTQLQTGSITESVVRELFHHRDRLAHPMALALIAYLPIAAEVEASLYRVEQAIIEAPLDTGFHSFIPESKYSAAVNGLAATVATVKLSCQMLRAYTELILTECEHHKYPEGTSIPKRVWFQARRYVKDHATSYLRNVSVLLLEAESWQEKTAIQVQALFNHNAQRATEQNLEIAHATRALAEESKRDSTSMKAIAAVTMFFLPGTFISSLFAIPVFNWSAPAGQSIVGQRIWIYLVFMIPLTLLTVGLWYLWYRKVGCKAQIRSCTVRDGSEALQSQNVSSIDLNERGDRQIVPRDEMFIGRHTYVRHTISP